MVAITFTSGLCTARMRLNLAIPPTIFVVGKLLLCIWFPTQPKMCRSCDDTSRGSETFFR